MTRHSKPPPPPRETLQDGLRSVAIAPTLNSHRKQNMKREATTPVEETVRVVLADRRQVEEVNARQTLAHQDAELRSVRVQIHKLGDEVDFYSCNGSRLGTLPQPRKRLVCPHIEVYRDPN
jgi:hypothetical protein